MLLLLCGKKNFSQLRRTNFVLLCFGLLLFNAAPSQSAFSSDAGLAEKIYLQLDNKVYTTDQTIWFKAILTEAGNHKPSMISGVLYVELIDPNENIVEQKLIKIDQGFGNGFFQLSPIYSYGMYEVRAYTEWNRNFGSRFFYTEYIMIAGPEGQQERNVFRNITLIEEKQGRRLQFSLDPFTTDSITQKIIPLYITVDEKKDTIRLRKNRDNQYLPDYAIPANARFVSLGVETKQHIQYNKTIVLDTTFMDLQFFPESGEMVHGLPSLLGIKLLRYDGMGQPAEGTIANSKGQMLASFKTNELGMGSVWLDRADTNEIYTARILSSSGVILPQTYSLPAVTAKGTILSVRKADQKISLNVRSNYLDQDSIVVRVSCRGIIYYDIKARLKNSSFEYTLPANVIPEGIINFTLMTRSGIPIAERLYFNERPGSRILIAGTKDRQTYTQREKTELSLAIKDSDGKPLPAHLSVMVINRTQQGSTAGLHQNILSYFLLSSDLKGEIENPGFYFSNQQEHFNDLDALLLTQGWSKYNYTREPVSFQFNPEPYLLVSGNVKGGLSNKKIIKDANLTLVTIGLPPSYDKLKTDSLGRFVFALNDTYGQSTDIFIQSADKSNKRKDYLITVDQKQSPQVFYDHRLSVQKPDSLVQAYINISIKDKKAEEAYINSVEGRTLEAVVVKSRILSDQQKLVTEKYGAAKTIIDGKAIRDKEPKWSYGLYSVLMFRFPDQLTVFRGRNGSLNARINNSEITLVVIDGIAVKSYEYSSIQSIPPSEVKSVELIPYAKNFRELLCDAFPDVCSNPNVPTTGNVIAIYTFAGKGLSGARATVGVKTTTVPVFSPTREFYAPKYEQLKPEDWRKPDIRTLVHWAPDLSSDSTGRRNLSFYNADATGKTQVIVEAISESGELGYQEFYYDVKKRE